MPDTCGPTSHEQLTCFDLGSASSRTSKGTSVKGESRSWSRLSQWGTASSGGWFELPTPAPLTAARGSSSSQLLGTPTAQSSATGRSDGPVYDPTSGKAPNPAELAQLLPTPRATDGSKGGPNQVNGRGVRDSLPGLVPTLLPTPTAQAAKHGSTPDTTANGYGSNSNLWDLPTLLPTPTTQDAHNNGGPSQRDRNSLPLNALVPLLPTPAVNDMGRGKTPEQWDEWTAKMQASHSNGNGHGKSLDIEAQRLLPTPTSRDHKDGASSGADVPVNALLGRTVWALAPTRQPSDDGNTSSEGQHPNPLSPPDATADTDSTHA